MNDYVSIIVPVYNVEKYIEKCLKSLINQTYKKIEIIVIDDGSTDESGTICDKYANMDSRISVVHCQNGGVSKARNVGISKSNGEFIIFVDSDDFVEDDMIEIMYKKMKASNADIVICSTNNINEKNTILNDKKESKEMILNNIEALKCMLNEIPYNNVCWGKLYKKELFLSCKFNEKIRIAEDLDILYKIFFRCNKIVYIPDKKYNWLVREQSVTKEKFNEKWIDEINVCEEIIKFSKENCKMIEDYAIKRYIRINVTCALNVIRNNAGKENLKYLQNNIRKYKIKNKNILDKKLRLKVFIILNAPYLAKVI